MFARVDFSTLTLMDALDLACMIEMEAFQRYATFAEQLGYRTEHDAASVFRSMATNEKKHGEQLAERRKALFGSTPAKVTLDDVFDVEAPEAGAPRRTMSQLKALNLALSSEKKALAFYDGALPYVKDAQVKALFQELREEEVEHVAMVNKLIAAAPKSQPPTVEHARPC